MDCENCNELRAEQERLRNREHWYVSELAARIADLAAVRALLADIDDWVWARGALPYRITKRLDAALGRTK